MRQPNAPRYQGRISSWKDEQGFGFIARNGGGPSVFVHIKSFADRSIRPVEGDVVTYELSVNDRGQPRAERVAFVGGRGAGARERSGARPGGGTGAPLIACGFFAALAIAVLLGRLPPPALGLYAVASLVAFVAYGLDKSAARKGRWRTRESTLHVLALVGGWPGALLAQRVYRHKSKKQSFQLTFWFTVLLNCGLLVLAMAPAGTDGLRRALGLP